MRLVRYRHATIPLGAEIRNAAVSFRGLDTSMVALEFDVGAPQTVVGFGYGSIGRYSQRGLIEERYLPRLVAGADAICDPSTGLPDPERALDVMIAPDKPGGHGDRSVALAAIDMALWDAVSKAEQRPLYAVLSERYRGTPADKRVWAYAAGGYYPTGRPSELGLPEEIRRYAHRGYTTVKIKMGGLDPVEDFRRLEAAMAAAEDSLSIAVDFNGKLHTRGGIDVIDELASYPLAWLEEPCDPLDFGSLQEIGQRYMGVIATGENLFGAQEVLNLVTFGGLDAKVDYIQVDPNLAYGAAAFARTLAALKPLGWEPRRFLPHGGHQFNLNVVAGFGLAGCESYPGVFAPIGGFSDNVKFEEGWLQLPEYDGIGLEQQSSLNSFLEELRR